MVCVGGAGRWRSVARTRTPPRSPCLAPLSAAVYAGCAAVYGRSAAVNARCAAVYGDTSAVFGHFAAVDAGDAASYGTSADGDAVLRGGAAASRVDDMHIAVGHARRPALRGASYMSTVCCDE
eukprot:1559080-Rhodomonas_salina.5